MKNTFRKPKYTAGPWKAAWDQDYESIVIDSENHSVCVIDSPADFSSKDALLIEKTPEIYEGLVKLVDYVRLSIDLEDQPKGFVEIRELVENLKKQLF